MIRFIVNPAAGGGRGRRAAAALRQQVAARAAGHTVLETTSRGHAVELAREAAAAGASAVVAAGGDGTVHEVAHGLLSVTAASGREPPALGVLPIGTGNDFAKLLATGRRVRDFEQALERRAVHRFDAGLLEWEGGSEHFVNAMGLGIDVEVVRQIERLPRVRGVLGYLLGVVRALAHYRPLPLEVRVDGASETARVMMVAVSNGRCVGGGFHLCPEAKPDDGRFDVCMIRELNLIGIARTLPRTLRGTHGRMPGVSITPAREVEILAGGPEPLVFQLDGELREPPAARRIRVSILAGALPVLMPRREIAA